MTHLYSLKLVLHVYIINITADGIWAEWSSLYKCTNETEGCTGNFTHKRNRTCTNPQPYLGGDYCPGNDTQYINQGNQYIIIIY